MSPASRPDPAALRCPIASQPGRAWRANSSIFGSSGYICSMSWQQRPGLAACVAHSWLGGSSSCSVRDGTMVLASASAAQVWRVGHCPQRMLRCSDGQLLRLRPAGFVGVPWRCRVSPQHRPTKLTPQPQWLASSQPLEQLRVRHRPSVLAATPLQLRLAVLLRIRRSWLARSTPRHRPDVARNQITDRLLLCCHRRHRCPVCVEAVCMQP
jgi:hypothetical protein